MKELRVEHDRSCSTREGTRHCLWRQDMVASGGGQADRGVVLVNVVAVAHAVVCDPHRVEQGTPCS